MELGFFSLKKIVGGIDMSVKNDTEVVINGKVLTVSGNESAEYMQKVAAYINTKISDLNKLKSFKRQSVDKQNTLIQLNIADDYFKVKNQIELLERDLKAKENELYDLKHELIGVQMKLDETSKSLKEAKDELNENSKQIVRLETELKECQK
jgi:cell division protein ZapA